MHGSAAFSAGHGKGPKTRICYVCGRGYGLASYDIHLKQCKAKWEAAQQGLPSAERKPLPREPDIGAGEGGTSQDVLDAQNNAATQAFNNESLDKCVNCGRTFMADRLKIHQKSCTAQSPAKRVGAARLSSTTTNDPSSALKGSRPRTATNGSGMARTAPASAISGPNGHPTRNVSAGSAESVASGHNDGDPPLAGNYGGIGRRSTRVHSANLKQSSTSDVDDQSIVYILEERLSRVEQELQEFREEVKNLRGSVEALQPPAS